jgi:hypothetical protein
VKKKKEEQKKEGKKKKEKKHIHYLILNVHINIDTLTSFYLANFNKTTVLYKTAIFLIYYQQF